jgi:hypothetical protein
MSATLRLIPVQEAYEDLLQRTLARISSDLGRLIYLASTRDYNTGNYHHDGLAARFRPEIARKALEIAHRQVFCQVAAYSLEELVEQLETYIQSSRESRVEILGAWQKLEPYRIAIPAGVNSAVARLFLSNVRLALAISRFRLAEDRSNP